jgi:2,3-bisphosphoglycerate-independent phosphoglycerate mutase
LKPLVLVILDGWGLSPETEGNAILSVATPNLDKLISMFPYSSLRASGEEVGLEWGEMGNSEVGHLNLGTGRVVMQSLTRIDKTIDDGAFFNNSILLETFSWVENKNGNLHLICLFSSGGVHSHMNHLFSLLKMAKMKKFNKVFVHLISDGRDTAPKVILQDLKKLEALMTELGIGKIASVMGRYYGMDRDKHWERTQKALDCLTGKNTPKADNVQAAIEAAYKSNQTDEFISPVQIAQTARVKPGDAVIFYNFRADRAKQISQKIIELGNVFFTSFTSFGYEPTPLVKIAFLTPKINQQLGMILSKNNLSQLHVAETEKYAHVTYFFNGGWEQPFDGEKRLLIPSPRVETYDLKPEMSAKEVTTKFIESFKTDRPAFTVLNFANADMVGHTGVYSAVQSAIKTVDENLGKIAAAVLNSDADLIVTADHGNAEQMINLQTREVDKEHTTNPVPFVLAFKERARPSLLPSLETKIAWAAQPPIGVLADITATITKRIGLDSPPEITGQSLTEVM